jgi:hypothetical protein
MQTTNKDGELAIAVCPDCNFHSVCDPAWLAVEGQTLNIYCENCATVDKETPHLITRFIRKARASGPFAAPVPLCDKRNKSISGHQGKANTVKYCKYCQDMEKCEMYGGCWNPPDEEKPSIPSDATPCSLSDFVIAIHEAEIGWVSNNIHPHVARSPKYTNASYLRKMALWAMATNTFPPNAELSGVRNNHSTNRLTYDTREH